MASLLAQRSSVCGVKARSASRSRLTAAKAGAKWTMQRPVWLPGSPPPAHLDGTLPGDYGFDPLGLGANSERLSWFKESELVHCRWAMLGVAGILGQEIFRPDVFWYEAALKVDTKPFGGPLGLLAIEFFLMHWVEARRGQDFYKPGSVDQDPIFTNNKLAEHEVGYPGFTFFIPGDLTELKKKEIANGRLAMVAFVGFVMAAQVNGSGPLAALSTHLADPLGTTIFSKAIVVPGTAVVPTCAIPSSVVYEGLTIPTPCFLSGFWP